jgi:hypothetical protein
MLPHETVKERWADWLLGTSPRRSADPCDLSRPRANPRQLLEGRHHPPRPRVQAGRGIASSLITTSPRRMARASVNPWTSRCPVAIDRSPRIGRSRSFTGTCDRSIGCVVACPGARCSPVTVWTASGTCSQTARW